MRYVTEPIEDTPFLREPIFVVLMERALHTPLLAFKAGTKQLLKPPFFENQRGIVDAIDSVWHCWFGTETASYGIPDASFTLTSALRLATDMARHRSQFVQLLRPLLARSEESDREAEA